MYSQVYTYVDVDILLFESIISNQRVMSLRKVHIQRKLGVK